MRGRIRLVLFLAGLLLTPLAVAHAGDEPRPAAPTADVIVLKNGSVFEGRIVKESDTEIILEHGSVSGGTARITLARADVSQIRRGTGQAAPRGGERPIRNEWFLLRSGGRIVGTRHLELWSVRTGARPGNPGRPGFRLEEHIEFFAQGPQLPATRTHRVEVVDLRFFPLLLSYREIGDASGVPGGPRRYERSISGNVKKGVWYGASFVRGVARRHEVPVPGGVRGRLGFREHLLRLPRKVQLIDAHVIDPDVMGLVRVRAGFAAIPEPGADAGRGHEFHWEEGDRRLISFFHRDTSPIREEVAEGLTALPASREQAEAATSQAGERPADPEERVIKLPEAGIGFMLPGPLWTWTPSVAAPANTGWRVLGRLDTRVYLADVRVEWHPREPSDPADPARVETWLLRRLRGASPDLQVVKHRAPLVGLSGAWRLDLLGTLKREKIRSVAVVVDRPLGRVVLLLACPAAAWEQGRPALDRFLSSLRLL